MNYWEQEQPKVVDTGKNILRYFPQAGKLQVCQPNWTDGTGQEKQGKTVTLDIQALTEMPEAVDILKEILSC